MTGNKGPWDREPEAPPPTAHKPFPAGLWIGIMLAVGVGIWALSRLFPGAVASRDDWSSVVYGLGALTPPGAKSERTRVATPPSSLR